MGKCCVEKCWGEEVCVEKSVVKECCREVL